MFELTSGLCFWLGAGFLAVSLLIDVIVAHLPFVCRGYRWWHVASALLVILLGPLGLVPVLLSTRVTDIAD